MNPIGRQREPLQQIQMREQEIEDRKSESATNAACVHTQNPQKCHEALAPTRRTSLLPNAAEVAATAVIE